MGKNILVHAKFYPCTVARFFVRGFRRLGHNVLTVGAFSPTLPWTPRDVSKYIDRPDLETVEGAPLSVQSVVDRALRDKDFRADVVVQVDAGHRLSGKASVPNVVIATDPHAFPPTYYAESFKDADLRYCMQDAYMHEFQAIGIPVRWLPYAFDPEWHYWDPHAPKDHFVTLITGLMYPMREAARLKIEQERMSYFMQSGYLFDEGTEIYNRGTVALNWSSRRDLPMRFWEGLAYRNVMVTDRCYDLGLLDKLYGIKEGVHYLAFGGHATPQLDLMDMATQLKMVRDNPSRYADMAALGYSKVWQGNHTYTARAEQIVRDVEAL